MSKPFNYKISHKSTNINNNQQLYGCFKQLFISENNFNKLNQPSKLLSITFIVFIIFISTVSTSQIRHSSHEDTNNNNSIRKNCTKCSLLLENAKVRRLESFKREFLHKLGFKEPPKVTIDKSLYNIPPLDTLFMQKSVKSSTFDQNEMLGDQPYNLDRRYGQFEEDDSNNEMDDSTGNIKKFISFAQVGKLLFQFFTISTYLNLEPDLEKIFHLYFNHVPCKLKGFKTEGKEYKRATNEFRLPPVS